MVLAQEAGKATQDASNFAPFDIFMLLFTAIIFIGFVRLVLARPRKNYFAIGFAAVSLLVFLVIDYIMIFEVWMG
ncbi:hypothetical protein BG53_00730 [Paenibacillus darwinianus]|uniref:DUF2759 domain-containing protein n=1 Tax=Paenibacillus darwinianus TaxID=1380763 RepID=A0A9W5W7J6_9BACL|nr:hypothetical protein [Paenibacillus darwinianus]EXX88322.1 hypothetical protein CH50_03660 [Paenibacillus darwinianus]EXX89064.1 hypothetical protein BG53_00730 [Paenibacillus darwinianus]EXX89334.1 hypothetical protein BG52_15660 [Paenibacillus darwinianus]